MYQLRMYNSFIYAFGFALYGPRATFYVTRFWTPGMLDTGHAGHRARWTLSTQCAGRWKLRRLAHRYVPLPTTCGQRRDCQPKPSELEPQRLPTARCVTVVFLCIKSASRKLLRRGVREPVGNPRRLNGGDRYLGNPHSA